MLLARAHQFASAFSAFATILLAPSVTFGQRIALRGEPIEIDARQFARSRQTTILDAVALPRQRSALLVRSPTGVRVAIVSSTGAQVAVSADLVSTIGLRLPKAITNDGTRNLYVVNEQGSVLWFDAEPGEELHLSGSRHPTLATASDICALRERLFILGVDNMWVPGPLVRVLSQVSDTIVSFGDQFGASADALLQTTYNSGHLLCDSSHGRVIVASRLLPEVRAYNALTGELLWTTRVPNFRPMEVDRPNRSSVVYRLPADSIWDQVVGVFSPAPGVVAIQSGRRRGLRSHGPYDAIRTDYFEAGSGVFQGSQRDLHGIVTDARGGWLYMILSRRIRGDVFAAVRYVFDRRG